jgi:hypothetical protein
MPGPLIKTGKLGDFTMTINQQMRGDFEMTDLRKIRIRLGIQTISKKVANIITAELIRRQTNIVDHQQTNIRNLGTLVCIG